MSDHGLVEHVAHALLGLGDDILQPLLDAVADVAADLDGLSHDDVVHLVDVAVKAAVGTATTVTIKHLLEQRRVEVRSAVQQALAPS